MSLAPQARSDAKPGQTHPSVQAVHQYMSGLYVFVNDTVPMDRA